MTESKDKQRNTTPKTASSPPTSASHLVDGDGSLNHFEFGLTVANQAFQGWMARCMAAAGNGDLASIDILLLHHVYHHERPKRLGDICMVLHIDDSHTAAYSLRKLGQQGLVQSERRGKEAFYSVTDAGRALCEEYGRVRKDCLVPMSQSHDVEQLGNLLLLLSGMYDQAARLAATRWDTANQSRSEE